MSRRRQVGSTEEKAFDRLHIGLAQQRLQGIAVHTPLVLYLRLASRGASLLQARELPTQGACSSSTRVALARSRNLAYRKVCPPRSRPARSVAGGARSRQSASL